MHLVCMFSTLRNETGKAGNQIINRFGDLKIAEA